MTEALLEGGPADAVLEVGTGCGYQTAVLAPLVAQLYTIERIEPLLGKLGEQESLLAEMSRKLDEEAAKRIASEDSQTKAQLAALRELTLFFAPNINSYKRFADGSFAPTALAWGLDNRTCALRVVGHGRNIRVECRVAGGDVNQYLAVAALIAGGLSGIERGLELREQVS